MKCDFAQIPNENSLAVGHQEAEKLANQWKKLVEIDGIFNKNEYF